MPGIKHLQAQFTEEQFKDLETVKGDRTWEAAILEEFGVLDDD
jgi:hypothetical protein